MIGRAIEQNSEFGIVLAGEGEAARAGCTAHVEKVTRRYEDGRFDIEILGLRRFRVITLDDSEPCLQAAVEFFEDEETEAGLAELERAVELAKRVSEAIGVSGLVDESPGDPRVSFQIASALALDLAFKQQLLEARSEAERIRMLIAHLSELMDKIERTKRAQKLASHNGKPKTS